MESLSVGPVLRSFKQNGGLTSEWALEGAYEDVNSFSLDVLLLIKEMSQYSWIATKIGMRLTQT
jgi:hypothetical protein